MGGVLERAREAFDRVDAALEELGDRTGIPTYHDVIAAQKRAIEAMNRLRERLGLPTNEDIEDFAEEVDDEIEDFGDRTGIPTYHDVLDYFRDLADRLDIDLDDDSDDDDEPSEDEEDDGFDWGWLVFAWIVASWLAEDHTAGIELGPWTFGAFEITGIHITETQLWEPGPPLAARVGDPMAHGGVAAPGPGESTVRIGGRPALTTAHQVVCPMVDPIMGKHSAGTLTTNNTSVKVKGAPLLRVGDCAQEFIGGPNPVVAGCPTVQAGPPAPPVTLRMPREVPLSEIVPGLERIKFTGITVKVKPEAGFNVWDWAAIVKATGSADLGKLHFDFREDLVGLDGEPDIARARVTVPLGKVDFEAKIKPAAKIWKSRVEVEQWEYQPGGEPEVQVQVHDADQEPQPWE